MKLLRLHIDDFGCLHNYDYEFEDGLNVVLHDNGWGKTTMGVFLKAMLYGFGSKRSKDITENERRRYFPWQGGKYGGSLDFEAEGVRYRILRTFGETPRFDKTKILNLDSGTTARIDPENIGESLFRLDVSAFQRSVFINQNGLSLDGAASSIHTRLNALVSQANDVAAFDGAVAALTSQIKVYEKTGARGQIGDITRQISALERQRDQLEDDIAEQDRARDRIQEIDQLLSALKDSLAENKKKLDEVFGEARKREASEKLLRDLEEQIARLQEKMDSIRSDLGGQIPSGAEIEQVKHQKQLAASLTQQLADLERRHSAREADYARLLAAYGGALPNTAQLDELQSIYGELQGIRAAGGEADEAAGEEPEGYTLIKAAADTLPDYAGRLRTIVGTQETVQQQIHALEKAESEWDRERDSWSDQKKRYAALTEEATRLQEEAGKAEDYSPETIGPVISALEALQERHRTLTQQSTDQDGAIRQEADGWSEKMRRYASLKEEVERLRRQTGERSRFAPENAAPTITELEELQKQQQIVDMKSEELRGEQLTAEQRALLAQYPGELPDTAEGNRILKTIRVIAKKISDLQGLEARKAGEQSRADSLRVSIGQLAALPDEDAGVVEEPKRSPGAAMIGAGAAAAVLGAVLMFVIAPVMAVVAVAGAILAVLGVVSHSGYQTKLKTYEAYRASATQRQETQKKKAELQSQLDATERSVASLQEQLDGLNRDIQTEQAAVDSWAANWLSGGEATEDSVAAALDHARQVAKLREKQRDADEKERLIQEKKACIAAGGKKLEGQFPELAGKSLADALDLLRSSQTDYKLYAGQLQTSEQKLEQFFAETGFTAEQLSAGESPRMVELERMREQIRRELEEVGSQRGAYEDAYPELAGASYDDALKTLRAKEANYRVADGQRQTAVRNLEDFLRSTGHTEGEFAAEDSPEMAELASAKDRAAQALAQAMEDANEVLAPLGLDTNSAHIVQALREAEQMLHEYQQYADKLRGHSERQRKRQEQLDALQKKLKERLTVLHDRYPNEELPARLALIREETGTADKDREKLRELEAEQAERSAELEDANKSTGAFIAAYGRFSAKTEDILAEICGKVEGYSKLAGEKQQLEKQKNAIDPAGGTDGAPAGAEETELRAEIARLEEQRDGLRDEYTHKSDFIRQTDQSLEKYPDVVQEIHQLYKQKQKAQNTLAVLKRTMQLMTQAKENLANRYLSKVEQLFNNYMRIWLDNDAVRGILDIDFNVTIEENDKVHVAEGYSTGSCDLIDFCMRLALVDTLFESEQPFLILDDPFVNLDAERLDKALELLNVMAASKQIVYFVCHPIRAVEAEQDSEARAEFVRLAETARKTIASRSSMRGARKRPVRKSPKELYHVVNPDGTVAIRPAKSGDTITNSIFSLRFVLSDPGVTRDHSYELFFIDAVGHVMNDRQLIEIKNGKLSTEQVQFCLNTRDDSGSQYELMIRESGQDDYEVVARIPYKAKLAFAGTFSFDL